MIRYAVMTFMYRGKIQPDGLSHEQLIGIVADAGGDGLEAFHRDFVDDPGLIPRYRRALDANGVSMPVIDIIANLAYADAAGKRAGVDELRAGLDVCAELGAEIAHVAGHCCPEGVSPADGRKMIADTLAEHADHAAERGLTLAIEDFDPAPDLVCRAADCLDILEQSGRRVKLVFDTGNFQAVGERADEHLDELYDHTVHWHFKDFVLNTDGDGYHGCHFGRGIIPNRAVASELQRRGYDGWVALESYPQNGAGPAETVGPELATLKAMLARG